jgi:hypothetical protein
VTSGIYRNKHMLDVDFAVMKVLRETPTGKEVFGYWVNRRNPDLIHAEDTVLITWEKMNDWRLVDAIDAKPVEQTEGVARD